MPKKAFCVGINDYPYEGSDLNGCVNDAYAWAELLRNHFDFPSSDVKLITDSDATKKNIMEGLKNLLSGVKGGDVLVFTNSSHGTYIADTSGDEERYDEALCPYDVAENLITDDELRELFVNLPEGVHMTVISDSCHSGTVTRAAIGDIIPFFRTPDHRRVRFLHPALRGGDILYNPWKARTGKEEKHPESKMKEILLSGCKDSEYSYDALIEEKYHGAMTFYAINAIVTANYKITYNQLVEQINYLLEEASYPQHPQLEGNLKNKRKQIFT